MSVPLSLSVDRSQETFSGDRNLSQRGSDSLGAPLFWGVRRPRSPELEGQIDERWDLDGRDNMNMGVLT
jgi:hypothetical protein